MSRSLHIATSPYQRTSKLMFATVSTGINPTIARGRRATGVTNLDPPDGGAYAVRFDRPIGSCIWVATAGPGGTDPADAEFAVVRARAADDNDRTVSRGHH